MADKDEDDMICPVCKKEITFAFDTCKVCKQEVCGGCFYPLESMKRLRQRTCKKCDVDHYMGAGI
jgi:hypothetical protein